MGTDLGETEEGIVLAAAQAGAVETPEKNQSETCASCGAPIKQVYCGNCGQKNDDLRRSLWRLISESLGGIFSFEGRMWRTWAALLFKPGKVAREYANGARTRYSPPIRVYLVISFMFFAFLALSQTNIFAVFIQPEEQTSTDVKPPESSTTENHSVLNFNGFQFKFLFLQTQKKFDELNDKASTETFIETLKNETDVTAEERGGTTGTESIKVLKTFLDNPKKFNAAFNTWLPRVMFFMVPFAMLTGAIFIRGPTALLYDHLIHAIYIHSVFFITLLLAILLARLIPGGLVAIGLSLAFLIYLPLSLRRMFKRGWFKTILTTVGVGTIYALFLISAILMISIYSIANLAA